MVCSKSQVTNAKCANCGGRHLANYRGCSTYVDRSKRNHMPQSIHSSHLSAKVAVKVLGNSQGLLRRDSISAKQPKQVKLAKPVKSAKPITPSKQATTPPTPVQAHTSVSHRHF
uniref:Uncharacterized protein n=1 Tax=Clastoptera arizonana TaxID=38151 RepID=A0A1B6DQ15_9HEMI